MAESDITPTETVETPPETPAPEATTEPVETPAEDPVKEQLEGLSKGLQKVTQILTHLQKKSDGGEELNRVEQAKLEQAREDAAKLKNSLENFTTKGETGDDEGIELKATKGVLSVMKRLDKLEAENQALREKSSEPTPDQAWAELEEKTPGARTIWKNSIVKAMESTAIKNARRRLEAGKIDQETFDELLQGATTDIYDERASAAQGRKLPVAAPAPPKPPLGARSAHMPGAKPVASAAGNDPVAQAALERLSY